MKKRAMKKWIPEGMYCHGNGTKKYPYCKWLKYIKTLKLDKTNCDQADGCDEICWSKPNNSCTIKIYKCEYMNYTDFKQESLLWDAVKCCNRKE